MRLVPTIRLFVIVSLTLFTTLVTAQAPPDMFSYSAIVRDALSLPLNNMPVGVRFSILKGSATGPVVYQETNNITTNAVGLINLNIGSGTVVSGSIGSIDWSADEYYLQVDMDIAGGTNYQTMNTSQLVSVPYALYARSAGLGLNDHDTSDTNELQTISISNDSLFLSNGGSVVIPTSGNSYMADEFLYLHGQLSNAQADSIIRSKAGPRLKYVWINRTSQLTSVDLSGISELAELLIDDNADLVNLTVPNLKRTFGNVFIGYNENLSNISMDSLEYSFSNLDFHYNKLQTLSLPGLKAIFGTSYMYGHYTTLSLPMLIQVAQFFISSDSMTSLVLPVLQQTREGFFITGNSRLLSISCPALTFVRGFSCRQNAQLTSLSLPLLKECPASFLFSDDTLMANLTLPALEHVGSVYVHNTHLEQITFANLEQAGSFDIGSNDSLRVFDMPKLTRLDYGTIHPILCNNLEVLNMPLLQRCPGMIYLYNLGKLHTVDLASLEFVNGDLTISSDSILTSLSLPALQRVEGTMNITNNALTSFSAPLVYYVKLQYSLSHNHLSSTVVNQVLNDLVNLLPSGLNISLLMNYQTPPAPPTGQGIIDKQTLIDDGHYIGTD